MGSGRFSVCSQPPRSFAKAHATHTAHPRLRYRLTIDGFPLSSPLPSAVRVISYTYRPHRLTALWSGLKGPILLCRQNSALSSGRKLPCAHSATPASGCLGCFAQLLLSILSHRYCYQFSPSWLRASSGLTRPHSLSRLQGGTAPSILRIQGFRVFRCSGHNL